MTLTRLVDALARPPGRVLAWAGVSPNAVTLLGAALNVALAIALAVDRVPALAAGVLILLLGFFDSIDGAVARAAGRTTEFGGFLDAVVDRLSDRAILLGLMIAAHRHGETVEMVLLGTAILLTPLVSYARARADALGIEAAVGVMDRTARIVVLGLGVALDLVAPAAGVIAAGALGTAVRRVERVRQALLERGST